MKKKIKNTFIGAVLLMAVVTLFSFQSFGKPSNTSSAKICSIEGTDDAVSLYMYLG